MASLTNSIPEPLADFMHSLSEMLVDRWFNHIPLVLIQVVLPLSIVLIGRLKEQRYLARLMIFMNAIAWNLGFYGLEVHWLFGVFLNVMLLLGVVGLPSYRGKNPLLRTYHLLTKYFLLVPLFLLLGVIFAIYLSYTTHFC